MKHILIMAGGTGGHVFPGIAIAKALQSRGVAVSWLGTVGGMEKQWVEAEDIPFYTLSIKGLRGNGWLGWLKSPFNVFKAWLQARKIFKRTRPDLVLGMGGFVCGPGGLAAKSMGIDLVVHEQNAILGLTNKLLARFAKWVITAFEQTQLVGPNVVQIGNPVREGFEQIPPLSTKPAGEPFRLLVVGGSRGALALNKIVPHALALIPSEKRPQVVHQTGKKTLTEAQEQYQQAGVSAEVVPFIDDMLQAYSKADLVVCRSGALTVSELMAAARPAILVPFPFAVDDHQTANGKVLENMGGGEVIQQSDLTPQLLASKVEYWMESGHNVKASKRIREVAQTRATEKIVELLLKTLSASQ